MGRRRTQEQRAVLKTIFNSVQTGLLIIDPDNHTIIDANPAAVRMIGDDRDAIIGAGCEDFICHTVKGKCPVHRQSSKTGEFREYTHQGRRAEGSNPENSDPGYDIR